jgi:hypothetical protein
MFNDFIFTTPKHFARLHVIAPHARLGITNCELSSDGNHLVAFSTGVIVPSDILSSFEWAYNFMARHRTIQAGILIIGRRMITHTHLEPSLI